MKKTILILVIGALFIQSCKEKSAKIIDVSSIKIEGVQLDNGKLWAANAETTEGIKKMQQLVATFSNNNNLEKYTSLTTQLETEFSNVFAKCTMKGEAHNQLHNYLKPMIGIFENLTASESKIRKENYSILESHLAGYANYFE